MRKTTLFQSATSEKEILIDTPGLMAKTHSGRATAVKIGMEANAKVTVGRRVFWNIDKIQRYIDEISE